MARRFMLCLLGARRSGSGLGQALRQRCVASGNLQVMMTLLAGPGGKCQRAFMAFAKAIIFRGLIGETHCRPFLLLPGMMVVPGLREDCVLVSDWDQLARHPLNLEALICCQHWADRVVVGG
ncbi:MAG TPA: hypothetical protein VFO45_08160 [Sphingomicrobium sp.]|nr:hypothetical protein [Sphingomicrobium sp.]